MRFTSLLLGSSLLFSGFGFTQEQSTYDNVGKWSSLDQKNYRRWISDISVRSNQNETLLPVMQQFKTLIDTTPRIRMLFESMLNEVPHSGRYVHDLAGHAEIRDYNHLLHMINYLIQEAPSYSERKNRMSFVGLPINTLLNWAMGTESGITAFLDPEINDMLQQVLNTWAQFLRSEASANVLGTSPNDWFGSDGLHDLTTVANIGQTNYTFDEMFISNSSLQNRGYKSWDDFFVRLFREGIRPVASPKNDSVIANACESKPYKLQRNVKAHDKFWVKERPYSVQDMLGGDELAHNFIGGTVYQAFLSSLSYHRWHSPIAGQIVKTALINGTYYSEPDFIDLASQNRTRDIIEGLNLIEAQPYLTSVATRAVIYVEADNKDIGLVAFVAVGMAEVSTCEVTVKAGQRVEKGEQLGMFHYGGSTHCLLFGDHVNVTGFPEPGQSHNIPVRGQLAVVG